MKNKKKIMSIGFFISIITVITLIFRELYYIIIYLYNVTLGRSNKIAMMKLLDLEKETEIVIKNFEEEKNKIEKWYKNTIIKGMKIKGFKNTTLFAEWFVKEDSHKWVIVVHGYGACGKTMYYAGYKFFNKGFNVVLPDLRGHGISGANYIGMGWHDRIDIINLINDIIKKDKKAEIILYGVSMGASTVLMASGEELPKNVKCIIADCGYTSAYEVLKYQLQKVNKLPVAPFLNIVSIMCKHKNGYSLKEASTINQIRKNKLPIFFIHGDIDSFVPTSMVFKLYKNANCKKEIMIVKNAGHTVSEMLDRKNYWKRISLFLKKYC